jgi:hypothetical protein
MHKESLGSARPPYVDIRSEVQLEVSNIYIRGNTKITKLGIGCTGGIDNSNVRQYGTTSFTSATDWEFSQFYHTFIGTTGSNQIVIKTLGTNDLYVRTGESGVTGSNDFSRYSNGANGAIKLLPNHIHLATNTTAGGGGVTYPADDITGPFLDQFIHAKYTILFDSVFTDSGASSTTQAVRQGFIGKFGSNGHNSTKTRGVLLGNPFIEPEGGTITLGVTTTTSTIFIKAGVTGFVALPYVAGSASYGEANPSGDNPVITTKDNSSTTLELNLGGRSWRAGISSQYGSIVRTRNIAI